MERVSVGGLGLPSSLDTGELKPDGRRSVVIIKQQDRSSKALHKKSENREWTPSSVSAAWGPRHPNLFLSLVIGSKRARYSEALKVLNLHSMVEGQSLSSRGSSGVYSIKSGGSMERVVGEGREGRCFLK